MKVNKVVIIIVIIALLIFVIFPLLTKAGGGFLPKELMSKQVQCDVELSNPAFSKVHITGAQCSVTANCIKPFSFFGLFDEGNLKLQTSDASASKSYSIGELGTRQFSLVICTNQNNGIVKTVDTDGSITDSRSVQW